MTTEIRRSTKRERAWNAWSGSLAQLRRIARAAEDLANERRKVLRSDLKAQRRAEAIEKALRNEDGMPNDDDDDERVEWLLSLDHLDYSARVTERGDIVEGAADVVFSEVDIREVERVVFMFGSDYGAESLAVTFRKHPRDGAGVSLSVASADVRWAKLAFAQLSEEISKDVPSWSRLKPGSFGGSIAFTLSIIGAVVGLFVYSAMGTKIEGGRRVYELHAVPLVIIIAASLLPIIVASTLGSPKLLPHFEIRPEGSRPTGSKWLLALASFLGSCITAIVIGVYVNKIS